MKAETPTRKWRRSFLAAVAFLVALVTPLGAYAATYVYQVSGPTYLALATNGDMIGVCNGDRQGLAGAGAGAIETTIVSYPVGTTIARNRETMAGFADIENVITGENTYGLATLFHLYRDQALTDELHSQSFSWAVQHFLEVFGRMHSQVPADGGTLTNIMVNKAKSLAGPYTLPVELNGAGRELTVTGLGVKTAANNWYPDLPLTLAISGDATFTTGEKQLTLKTTEKPQSLGVKIQGQGEIKINVTVSQLPAETVEVYELARYQDLITSPRVTSEIKETISWNAKLTPVDFTLSTNVAKQLLKPGEQPIDNITITAEEWPTDLDGNPQLVNLTADLYGPYPEKPQQASAAPAGQTPIHTQLVTISAPGEYQTDPTKIPETLAPGYYTWVVSAQQAQQIEPTVLAREITHDFGMSAETFELEKPPVTAVPPPPPVQNPFPAKPSESTPPAPVEQPKTAEPPIESPTTVTKELPPPKPTVKQLPNTGPTDLIPLAVSALSFGIGLVLLRPRKI